MTQDTLNEAQRCLLCKAPRCTAACPVKTPVPQAMSLTREGRHTDAAELLFWNNPLSSITCQVCDVKRFCYGHCVLNARKVPIKWFNVEKETSVPFVESLHLALPFPGKGAKRVAVVGAGPAGIAASFWLRRKGFSVTLYDKNPKVGGVLRYGIPSFRLPKDIVDQYERLLREAGVVFVGQVAIGTDITLKGLRKSYDAVLLCCGAEIARKMGIPGEDEPFVLEALEYLKTPSEFTLGKKVIVIGGGNVAMDAARTAVRSGHDTTILYRKTFENMPAGKDEVEDTKEDGVKFEVFTVPVELRKGKGHNVAIVRSCENYTTEEGKVATRILEGTDREFPFDTMIEAVSEKPDYKILDGNDPSEMEDVFLVGDYAYGPRTVVEAVQSAKDAVAKLDAFLGGDNSETA